MKDLAGNWQELKEVIIIYTKENVSAIVVIPIHGNRDLPIGTLKGILKDSGLTEDDILPWSPRRWIGQIIPYFDQRTSQGCVEGINNKLKLIKPGLFRSRCYNFCVTLESNWINEWDSYQ